MNIRTGPVQKWITASRSSASQNCIQMRRRDEVVEVRDSKDPEGPVLRFAPGEFTAWLGGARDGEFDHLM